jgi:hypothetical protein
VSCASVGFPFASGLYVGGKSFFVVLDHQFMIFTVVFKHYFNDGIEMSSTDCNSNWLLGITNCWIWTNFVDCLHDIHECVVKKE